MENSRQQIKGTAITLFLKKGIENVSGYDIAIKAKIRYSIVEELYPEKIDLIVTCYKACESDMFQSVYGDLKNKESFKLIMKEVFQKSIIWALNNSEKYAYLGYIQSQPHIWTKENGLYPSVYPAVLNRIKLAIEEGVLKDHPLDFVIHFLKKMLNACVSYIVSKNTTSTEEYESLLEPMFDSCWNALKK